MNLLITGASGFVGRTLSPFLAAAGHALRTPTRVETGDIGPETEWTPHLDGIDAVVHLAARVHVMRDTAPDPLAAFRRVNTAGTTRLLDAAIASGVGRFVFLSSVKVNGERADKPLTAADRPAPCDPYGVSKYEAELAIREREERLNSVILRPPLVYGPGVGGNFLRLLKLVDIGIPLPFASIRNRRSLIHVGNLADAIRWALEAPPGTYLPSDGDDRSTPDLIRAVARALKQPVRLLPCPTGLVRLAGALSGQGAAVGRLIDSLTVDNALPDWRPPNSMESGLASVARWYLEASATRKTRTCRD